MGTGMAAESSLRKERGHPSHRRKSRREVKEMIGHSDLSMTDRYAHLTSMRKLSRQEDLARFYANAGDANDRSEPHRSHTNGGKGSSGRK